VLTNFDDMPKQNAILIKRSKLKLAVEF